MCLKKPQNNQGWPAVCINSKLRLQRIKKPRIGLVKSTKLSVGFIES